MNEKDFRDLVVQEILNATEFSITEFPDQHTRHMDMTITYEINPNQSKHAHIGAVIMNEAFAKHNEEYILNKVAKGLATQVLERLTTGARTKFGQTIIKFTAKWL